MIGGAGQSDSVWRAADGRPPLRGAFPFTENVRAGDLQRYALRSGDRDLRTVELRATSLVEVVSLPGLRIVVGRVAGIMFDSPEIVLHTETGTVVRGASDHAQVERALNLRDEVVRAAVIIGPTGKGMRVVWIHAAADPVQSATPDERAARFGREWSETLRILSQ